MKLKVELFFVAVVRHHEGTQDCPPIPEYEIVAGPYISHAHAVSQGCMCDAPKEGVLEIVSGNATLSGFSVV